MGNSLILIVLKFAKVFNLQQWISGPVLKNLWTIDFGDDFPLQWLYCIWSDGWLGVGDHWIYYIECYWITLKFTKRNAQREKLINSAFSVYVPKEQKKIEVYK